MSAGRSSILRCARCGIYSPGLDLHHLPSPLGERRRTRDIVVPLCRHCHNWVQHTKDGLSWEKENLHYLYGVAIGTKALLEGWDREQWGALLGDLF